jgi:hypothetical protein
MRKLIIGLMLIGLLVGGYYISKPEVAGADEFPKYGQPSTGWKYQQDVQQYNKQYRIRQDQRKMQRDVDKLKADQLRYNREQQIYEWGW